MKALPLLILPLFLTSCGLIQMPARLINSAIAPLTKNDSGASADPNLHVALQVHTVIRPVAQSAESSHDTDRRAVANIK